MGSPDGAAGGSAHRLARRQFAAVADRYARSESHATGDDLAWLADRAARIVSGLALDVACGGGFSTRTLAQAGHRVIGSDLTPESVLAARRVTPSEAGIRWTAAAAEALPFRSGSFGLVGCRIAPHHFADVAAFCGEVRRVCRDGGLFLMVDTVVPDDSGAARWIEAIERLRDPSHARALRVADWKSLLEEAGFAVEEITEVRKRHEVERWLERMACTGEVADRVRGLLAAATPAYEAAFLLERDAGGAVHAFTDTKGCFRAVAG